MSQVNETKKQDTKDTKSSAGARTAAAVLEPWAEATRVWIEETEKLRRNSFEAFSRAVDNTHALMRQGLELAAELSDAMARQARSQMERSVSFVGTMPV